MIAFEEEKNSLCPPKDLLLGSLATSEYPHDFTASDMKKKNRNKLKWQ